MTAAPVRCPGAPVAGICENQLLHLRSHVLLDVDYDVFPSEGDRDRDGAAMAVVVEPADADALPDVSPVYLYSSGGVFVGADAA